MGVKKLSVKQRGNLVSALRKIWRNSPTYNDSLKKIMVNKTEAKCPLCLNVVHKKLIERDHVVPIGGLVKGCKYDLNLYIERLLFTAVQAICYRCHQAKTNSKQAPEGLEDL